MTASGEPGSPITPDSAIRFLLARGLLSPAELVDGRVRVTDVGGRNVNLRVDSAGTRSYFLKQSPPGEGSRALGVEAWAYADAARGPSGRLAAFLPRLAAHDPARSLLVIELVTGAERADRLVDESGLSEMPRIGAALGRALAACHARRPGSGRRLAARRHRPSGNATEPGESPPWILDVHRPPPAMMRHFSPAEVTLVALVQANADAVATLDRLRDSWAPASLIHGDLKWSNVLVLDADDATPPPGAAGDAQVRIIDWEFASWGDPAWDVGSALHSFVVDGVAHATDAPGSAADAAQAFGAALPRAHPEIRRFCAEYFRDRSLRAPEAESLLERAIAFCGARLIQTAFESCARVEELPRFAAAELQVAFNVLARPGAARTALLGLPAAAGGVRR